MLLVNKLQLDFKTGRSSDAPIIQFSSSSVKIPARCENSRQTSNNVNTQIQYEVVRDSNFTVKYWYSHIFRSVRPCDQTSLVKSLTAVPLFITGRNSSDSILFKLIQNWLLRLDKRKESAQKKNGTRREEEVKSHAGSARDLLSVCEVQLLNGRTELLKI